MRVLLWLNSSLLLISIPDSVIFSIATVGAFVTYFKGQQDSIYSVLGYDDLVASLVDASLTLAYGFYIACAVVVAKYAVVLAFGLMSGQFYVSVRAASWRCASPHACPQPTRTRSLPEHCLFIARVSDWPV